MSAYLDLLREHETLLWWVGATSVVMFIGTLVAVPVIAVKLPEDYFTHRKRHIGRWDHHHPALRWTLIVLKNAVGVVFIVAGLAMLVFPGQGVITILIGVTLLDFPGKFRLERWIFQRRPIHRSLNWMRARAHRPPLQVPERGDGAED